MKPAIIFDNLSLKLKNRTIFSEINGTIYEGEKIGVIGPAASGKTSLLRLIVGELKPSQGRILLFPNSSLAPYYFSPPAFCAAFPEEHILFPTIEEELSRALSVNPHGMETKENLVAKWLEWSGLQAYAQVSPFLLSDSQKKMLYLAAAFIQEKHLTVLDAPLLTLDDKQQQKVINTIINHPATIIFSVSNTGIMPANREFILADGKIVA